MFQVQKRDWYKVSSNLVLLLKHEILLKIVFEKNLVQRHLQKNGCCVYISKIGWHVVLKFDANLCVCKLNLIKHLLKMYIDKKKVLIIIFKTHSFSGEG